MTNLNNNEFEVKEFHDLKNSIDDKVQIIAASSAFPIVLPYQKVKGYT